MNNFNDKLVNTINSNIENCELYDYDYDIPDMIDLYDYEDINLSYVIDLCYCETLNKKITNSQNIKNMYYKIYNFYFIIHVLLSLSKTNHMAILIEILKLYA
jgi:hypothetical protein